MLSENNVKSAPETIAPAIESQAPADELERQLRTLHAILAELPQQLGESPRIPTMGSVAVQETHLRESTTSELNRRSGIDWNGVWRLLSEDPINARRVSSVDATPLQIWEGTVLEVDDTAQVMHVLLDAKMGDVPRHTGDIDLEWVAEQDRDLVQPGAVFYLTLFKRTTRGSVQNSQELRFRRRPAWSPAQIKQVERDAAMLRSKMKKARTAP